MKKLIALMMCAMLLLSGCSAVTAEGPGRGFQLGDLVVTTASGETLDLTGLSVGFELAESDTGMGSRAVISVDGQESADIVWASVGQYLYLSLPGTEGPHSYALDLAKVLQVLSEAAVGISEQISGIIPAIFPGTGESVDEAPAEDVPEMTDEELAAAMAELEDALAELEESGELEDYAPEDEDDEAVISVPDMSEELMEVQQQMQEKLNEILERCVTVDMTQLDGEDFQVIAFNIGQEDMAELISALPSMFRFSSDGSSGVSLSDIISAANVSLALQGTITGNQDFSKFEIDTTYDVAAAGKEFSFNFDLDNMAGNGVTAVSLSLGKDGQPSGGISLRLASTVTEDASWLPSELGEDTMILTEMPLEQVKQVLADGFNDYIAVLGSIGDSVAEANQAD